MYHPSYLTPKTILKIQTAQRSVSLSPSQHANARFVACCFRAARVDGNPEAIEQLRILENITAEAHEAFVAGSIEAAS